MRYPHKPPISVNNHIKISLKKKEEYDKLISILEELYVYNRIALGKIASDIYCTDVNIKIDSLKDDFLNFKEFVTDTKKDDELVEIDYNTYEIYIRASHILRTILIGKKNHSTKNLNDFSYRISLELSIYSYKSI